MKFLDFTNFIDNRGNLVPIEFTDLPFIPQRVFFITDIPPNTKRAGHGHKTCQQLLFPVTGRVGGKVKKLDGNMHPFTLAYPEVGLLIEPGEILHLDFFTPDASILVLASHPYDPEDYIYD